MVEALSSAGRAPLDCCLSSSSERGRFDGSREDPPAGESSNERLRVGEASISILLQYSDDEDGDDEVKRREEEQERGRGEAGGGHVQVASRPVAAGGKGLTL